jgi:hypothetical protein
MIIGHDYDKIMQIQVCKNVLNNKSCLYIHKKLIIIYENEGFNLSSTNNMVVINMGHLRHNVQNQPT